MSDMLYEVNDWIVHAHHGVGQVRGVDKRTIAGIEKNYLRVRTKDGEYWLPTQKTDVEYIRPISSPSTFRKALTTIRKHPEELPKDHKERSKEIAKFLETGALVRMARLIRDLNARRFTAHLNMSEEDTLLRIRKRFVNEWIISADMDQEMAEKKLDDALADSVSKIEQD